MKLKTYRATHGAHISNTEAQAIGPALEDLGPSFTPQDVVAAARDDDSPLHPHFEWQDDKAAALYREDQARSLVRSISIVVEAPSGETREVRAFHSITIRHTSGEQAEAYVPLEIVASDESMREQVLARAKRELDGWRRRYQDYRDVFGPVFEAIEAIELPRVVTVAAEATA